MKLRGVIFDMDGTVFEVAYDWSRIRQELDTGGQPVLDHLSGLSEPQLSRKRRLLEEIEEQATSQAVLRAGMRALLDYLSLRGLVRALVTNNSRRNVDFLLEKYGLSFDCVLTRESGMWKPSAEPFRAALHHLGIDRKECCVVGDSRLDIHAAEEAGIDTIFILGLDEKEFAPTGAVVCPDVRSLHGRIASLVEVLGA